jgi:hypothetical protein
MQLAYESTLLDDLLDALVDTMTPESARRVVALRASSAVQARFDLLAAKCNEGQLSPEEADQYDALLHALDFITVLQLKARKRLDDETDE